MSHNNTEGEMAPLAPFGPEADRHAEEHDTHPDPPPLSLVAKCPECYRAGISTEED